MTTIAAITTIATFFQYSEQTHYNKNKIIPTSISRIKSFDTPSTHQPNKKIRCNGSSMYNIVKGDNNWLINRRTDYKIIIMEVVDIRWRKMAIEKKGEWCK